MRAALRACYAQREFEHAPGEHLRLYAAETRALAASVRLPALLSPLREKLAEKLYEVMTDAGTALAREAARATYKDS